MQRKHARIWEQGRKIVIKTKSELMQFSMSYRLPVLDSGVTIKIVKDYLRKTNFTEVRFAIISPS